MATTLSEQLIRLTVPQTAVLVDSKIKASILFNAKEAANKDRKTIYALGCKGLAELISLNPSFKQFEDTLFEETTIHIERSVEDRDVNTLINKNITKFFHYLSPYFMLRPAHMCLEWLIRRFQIHVYNKNNFIALILPYHETNIFIKCVQVLKISKKTDRWNWMEAIQKPGIPLSKTAIINRAASNPEFLSFVCESFLEASKELGKKLYVLQAQINFHCSVVVGALEKASKIKEWHIATILPSLLDGLSSDVIDFASAAYIMTSQLVGKTKLTFKIINAFVSRICTVRFESLRTSAVLLLIWIFDTQAEVCEKLPEHYFLELIKKKWLTVVIASLAKGNVAVQFICCSIIKEGIKALLNKEDGSEIYKLFIEQLLFDVHFSTESVQDVIRCILDSFSIKQPEKNVLDDNVIEIESDDEAAVTVDFQSWYSSVLEKLEKQYPTAFDLTIKKEMQMEPKSQSARNRAIKIALGHRLKISDICASDLYEKLYHYTPKIRVFAVKKLIQGIKDFQKRPENLSVLKDVIADRLADDSENVVKEVLKLPTKDFVDFLGYQSFIEALLHIQYKTKIHGEQWSRLDIDVLYHLTSDIVVKNYDPNLILLSLMPFLIPLNETEHFSRNIGIILGSALTNKIEFLKELKNKTSNGNFCNNTFRKIFLDAISQSTAETPTAKDLLKSVENVNDKYFKLSTRFSHFLMLITACCNEKIDPTTSNDILRFIYRCCKHFKIVHFESNQWSTADRGETISLQLFLDFINTITKKTFFGDLMSWNISSSSLLFFMEIFNLLSSEAFSKNSRQDKLNWSKSLREFLDHVFPDSSRKIEFLSNFYVYECFEQIENFTELRLRSFKLTNLILKNKMKKIMIEANVFFRVVVALSSSTPTVRRCALETLTYLHEFSCIDDTLRYITKYILERNEEIIMDAEQLPLVLYTILNNKKQKEEGVIIMNQIMELICNQEFSDVCFKIKLLQIIKHIKTDKILAKLIPLALSSLDNIKIENNVKLLLKAHAEIFKLIMDRFDQYTIQNVFIDKKETWSLFEKAFKLFDTLIVVNGKLLPISYVVLESFDEASFEQLPNRHKINFIKLTIQTTALSKNDAMFLAANKLLKKCLINCNYLLPIFESMINFTDSEIIRKKTQAKSLTESCVLNNTDWKQGVIVLELLGNKRKLLESHVLIPVLFEILKRCLDIEDQNTAEYAKQLTLSAILHCYQKTKSDHINILNVVPKNSIRIDQIVRCVRETQNPQTHHYALLLLCHCAKIFPHQVLHNIVDIFTFMGSSVVRHDDAFSFHIISNIIESIIPVLVQSNGENKSDVMIVSVLKVFSDIMLDVPEHRRVPLYTKLLKTLGTESYLWKFLCVIFEAQVINEEKERANKVKLQHNIADKLPKRVEIALQLANTFSSHVVLQTCVYLIGYIKNLPIKKNETEANETMIKESYILLFDVKARSAKQFRHFKYIIMQFLSTLTSSAEFLKNIAVLDDVEILSLKPYYQNFIIKTLSFIPVVTYEVEKAVDQVQSKFWKVILHHLYDVLDNAISLLSPDMFLVVIYGLLQHKFLAIRKKVIELVISKLQLQNSYFDNCNHDNLHNLFKPLNDIINTILNKNNSMETPLSISNELLFIQQTALIAIKLLSKLFALKYIEDFKNILTDLTKILKKRTHVSKVVLATAILTMIEISSNLKAHSIAHLTKFMPHFIDALQDQAEIVKKQAPDNVCLALVTGTHKLFEALPLFLGPYIATILSALCQVWSYIKTNAELLKDQRSSSVISKLSSIWSKIAIEVPVRVLIPNCEKTYDNLLNDNCCTSIEILMKLILDSISNSNNMALTSVRTELIGFFLKALDFRVQMEDAGMESEINKTENGIITAFVAWVLKQSESSFRPLYNKVHEWAVSKSNSNQAILTYFMLSSKIAEALKSLFVIFAGDLIQYATRFLNECNTSKNETLYFSGKNGKTKNVLLIKNILSTLYFVFLYNNKVFINSHRFDILMQPLVDQLDNNLVLENDDLKKCLSSCISQLAVTVSSDILWKQLNYQVLLKTRTSTPEVRIISFNCCVEIAKKLGEDFTSLLPETIPFIAELLEDENARVEINSRKAVRELESILGESLQKYF